MRINEKSLFQIVKKLLDNFIFQFNNKQTGISEIIRF